MLPSFNAATLRLFHVSVCPRSHPVSATELEWLATALLTEGRCPGLALATMRKHFERIRVRERPSDDRRADTVRAQNLFGASLEFDGDHPVDRLIGIALQATAAKIDPSRFKAIDVADAIATVEPVREALGGRRASLYMDGWAKREKTTLPPPAIQSIVQRLLDRVIDARMPEAIDRYRAVLDHYQSQPTPTIRKEIHAAARRLPFPTAVIAQPLVTSGADCKASTKSYLCVEVPLPVLRPALDTCEIVGVLRSEFPWLVAAVGAIELDLLISSHYLGAPRLTPKMLVGPPGCGKTLFCRRVCELLEQPFQIVNTAGATSPRLLVGTSKGWGNSRPSLPIEIMAHARRAQCGLVVDELDKEGTGTTYGRFSDALLNMLEPSSATRYFDESLFAAVDLTGVSWLCTANSIETVSAPLLSRLQVLTCEQPHAAHMPAIAESTLAELRRQYRLPKREELLDAQGRTEMDASLPRCGSAREAAHLTRRKVGEALRRRFDRDLDRLPAAKATRMH